MNTLYDDLESNIKKLQEDYKKAYINLLEYPKEEKPARKINEIDVLILDNLINIAIDNRDYKLFKELSKEL